MLYEPMTEARAKALFASYADMPCEATALLQAAAEEGTAATVQFDCLSLRFEEDGLYAFTYPSPLSPKGEEEKLLSRLERYAMDEELPLVLTDVPSDRLPLLRARYPHGESLPLEESGEWHLFRALTEAELLEEVPTWEGKRVTLSPLTPEDAQAYAPLCRDSETLRYYGYDMREDLASVADADLFSVTLREWEERRTLPFAVRAAGRLVGEILLSRFDGRGGASLSVRLLREERGRGYAADAVRTLLYHAFRELSLTEVTALVREENLHSLRLFDRTMTRVGTETGVVHYKKTADAD